MKALAVAEERNTEAITARRMKAREDVEWMKEEVQQQLDTEAERQQQFDTLYRDEAGQSILLASAGSTFARRMFGVLRSTLSTSALSDSFIKRHYSGTDVLFSRHYSDVDG
jgi:hypothetical protein